MNMKPSYFLCLMLVVLGLPFVSPPAVRAQEKKPSPTAQSPDEKEKTLSDLTREFIAKDRAKKEALAEVLCQNLPDLWKMAKRVRDDQLTEQDKKLIDDRERFVETTNGLVSCSEQLSGDEKVQAMAIGHTLFIARVHYLESRERGLIAAYNDLAGDHNNLVDFAIAMVRNSAPSSLFTLPRLQPISPIRGPVVCTGDTIALGQGMTSFSVNCK